MRVAHIHSLTHEHTHTNLLFRFLFLFAALLSRSCAATHEVNDDDDDDEVDSQASISSKQMRALWWLHEKGGTKITARNAWRQLKTFPSLWEWFYVWLYEISDEFVECLAYLVLWFRDFSKRISHFFSRRICTNHIFWIDSKHSRAGLSFVVDYCLSAQTTFTSHFTNIAIHSFAHPRHHIWWL